MKQIFIATLLLAAFVLTAAQSAIGQTNTNDNTKLEAEVGKLLRDFYDAVSRRDPAAMNLIADNGFFYDTENGYAASGQIKEEFISYLKSPAAAGRKMSYEIEDLKVISAGGETVIANYRVIEKSEENGKTDVRRERYTNVFARRDGRWQLVAEHTSRLPKPLEPTIAGMPVGWRRTPSDSSNLYSMTVDTNVKHGGKASASIKFTCGEENVFGSLAQSVAADDYRGKRVRLTGWLKTENAKEAGLWMRVDGERQMLGFDNMLSRAVKGTTDWKQYQVVLDVPAEAVNIFFGTVTAGAGQVWADDFKLEIVGQEVPTTNQLSAEDMKREYPNRNRKKSDAKQPVNLGFENGAIQ